MTDPVRISDDADRELALLLRAGQREAPPPRALEKTIAGLGAATTVIGASHAASAAVSAGKLGLWTLAKWAGAGVVSGAITIGGVELVQRAVEPNRQQATAATSPATPLAANRSDESRQSTKIVPAAAPAPAGENAAVLPQGSQSTKGQIALVAGGHRHEAPVAKPSPAVAPPPIRAEAPNTEMDPTISVELGLIDEARRALRAGQPASALAAVNRHRTDVQRPRLAPEAQYLEMEAHFAAGNAAAAQKAAAFLLERYPRGPHAPRAQSILGAR